MSELYIVAQFEDGSLAHVALQTVIRTGKETLRPDWTDTEINRELARYIPMWLKDGKRFSGWRRISEEEHALFATRTVGERRWYRNALTDKAGHIEYDMVKARELHRDRLRHYRSGLLQKLDGEWMRAAGSGASIDALEIDLKRQRLRDLPQAAAIETAQSVEELESHWREVSA